MQPGTETLVLTWELRGPEARGGDSFHFSTGHAWEVGKCDRGGYRIQDGCAVELEGHF